MRSARRRLGVCCSICRRIAMSGWVLSGGLLDRGGGRSTCITSSRRMGRRMRFICPF